MAPYYQHSPSFFCAPKLSHCLRLSALPSFLISSEFLVPLTVFSPYYTVKKAATLRRLLHTEKACSYWDSYYSWYVKNQYTHTYICTFRMHLGMLVYTCIILICYESSSYMHLYLLTHLVPVFIPHSRHLTGNLSRGRSPDVLAPPCVFQVLWVCQSWYAPQFPPVPFEASGLRWILCCWGILSFEDLVGFSLFYVRTASQGSAIHQSSGQIVTSPKPERNREGIFLTNSDYLWWGLCFLGLFLHNLDGSISTGVLDPAEVSCGIAMDLSSSQTSLAMCKIFGWRGTGPVAALKCKQLLVLASSERPLKVSKTTKCFERTDGGGGGENAWQVQEA